MQSIKYILIFAILSVLVSCGSAPERPAPILDPNYVPPVEAGAPAATKAPEPPQNSVGTWHYTCPNGHSGGAGSATPCGECGTTLVHNTVYHDAPTGAPTAAASTMTANPTTAGGTSNVAPASIPNIPEPAQNASGVWHYTCPDGHSGGAGSASPCGECGTTLTHNQAYHG